MSTGVHADISYEALLHNLSVVRAHCPKQKIWVMVKANAYGHNLYAVSNVLGDHIDAFGVATLEEALVVRRVNQTTPVFVMRGFLTADEIDVMQEQNIGAVLHCWEQIELLEVGPTPQHPTAIPTPVKERGATISTPVIARSSATRQSSLSSIQVWIKIDTGMHRLGFQPEDIPKLKESLLNLPIKIEGWMTHLAQADELDCDMTQKQLRCFADCLPDPVIKSIANSAGILAHPDSHADWVRPGLMLYGVSAFLDKTGKDLGLKAVMTVTAPILEVKTVATGEGVGYGQTWTAEEDTPVATIGMGYGDAYPREVTGAVVVIDGVLCPVIGTVSMDMLSVDLRPLAGALPAVGSRVCIWGQDCPVEWLAKASGTIPYTLLTRMARRVEYKEEE